MCKVKPKTMGNDRVDFASNWDYKKEFHKTGLIPESKVLQRLKVIRNSYDVTS